jgi:membrane protein YqaA with SNARE-associated domain
VHGEPSQAEPASEDAGGFDDAELSGRLRGLLWSTLAALAILGLGLAAFAAVFGEPLLALGEVFTETLGGAGVVLGYLLPDALTLPIPADLVAALALFGGTPFVTVASLGAVGSVIGGALGWVIGRTLIARVPSLRRRMERDPGLVHALERSGPLVLGLAALTPMPFSVACWGVGALGMRFSTYFVISLLRVPRVFLYLWLVDLGAVTVAGVSR